MSASPLPPTNPPPQNPPPASGGSSRAWLFALAKLAIVALLIWGLHRTLFAAFEDLRQQRAAQAGQGAELWQFHFGWLAASGAFYLLGMLPSALFWHRVLRVLGQPVDWLTAVRAYYIGHLGKYVPGKAMVVVLRAGLIRGPEVNATIAAVTVFIETLTMMASGSLLAAVLIAWLAGREWFYAVGAIGVMLAAGLPTLPPIFRRLVRWLPIGPARKNPESLAEGLSENRRGLSPFVKSSEQKGTVPLSADGSRIGPQLHQIDYGTLLLGWLATGFGWLVMGLSLGATLRGMGQTSPGLIDGLPLTTMVVCVSVVAGFVSFIPGGLGVRDLVMAGLIERPLGAGVAVVSVIVLRVVWLVAELAVSAALYFVRLRPRPSAGN